MKVFNIKTAKASLPLHVCMGPFYLSRIRSTAEVPAGKTQMSNSEKIFLLSLTFHVNYFLEKKEEASADRRLKTYSSHLPWIQQ